MPIDDMVHRNLDRWGEPATIVEFTDTGDRDEQGDPSFDETETDAVALFRQPTAVRTQVASEAGVRKEHDTEVWVKDTHRDRIKQASDETTRATQILRDGTSEVFDVIDVWDENNGQLRVACIKEIS